MALINFFKSSTSGAALNLGTAWISGVVPNATTARAVLDTNAGILTSASLGGSLTWGQLQVLLGSTTNPFTINATSGATLTLTPTDVDAANVGLDFTTATRNITISCLVALGSDQQWTIGNTESVVNARTLTTFGIISGEFSLTVAGPGTWTQGSQVNTFGGVGKTVTIKDGTRANASVSGTFGNANNEIIVGNNGVIDFVANVVTPNQTQFRITGSGSYEAFPALSGRLYGSLLANAWSNTKTVTIEGTKAVIGLYSNTFAAKVTGTVTDTLEIMANDSLQVATRLTFVGNDFVALGGLLISSQAASNKASNNYGYDVGATDTQAGLDETTVFGNLSNSVRVLPSGQIYSLVSGTNTRTINRAVTFDGSASGEAIRANTAAPGATLAFAGPVTFSGNSRVQSNTSLVSFRNSISGTGNLTLINASTKVEFDSAAMNAFTDWTGTIIAPNSALVQYGFGYETLTNAVQTTGTGDNSTIFNNKLAQDITLQHSSYTFADDVQFSATNTGYTFSLGNGAVTGTASTVFTAAAGVTAVFPGNISSQLVFGKTTATGTCVVSGTNTRIAATGSTIGWASGNLHLNSARALGNGALTADAIVVSGTLGVLDNTSGSAVVLDNGGPKQLNSNFTWRGSNDLSLGTGNVTANADRIVTFANTGETHTLKFPGAITTALATTSWNFGGSTSGAKQRITLGGANDSQVAATAADQHSVTAGYFRIENNNGLGAAAATTTWWVGATNLGVQTTKAALELANVTTPDTKNVNLYNIGPDDDGALIGVSGVSFFSGAISVPNVVGTRIGVKSGATLTLLGSGIYPNLNPANVGTPLAFTAESGGTLHQNRILGNKVSTVTVTGGSGTVVFSRANTHTDAMICSAGTTKVTNVNATSTGNVFVLAGATLESAVQSQFQSTLSLGTTSSPTPAILKFAA